MAEQWGYISSPLDKNWKAQPTPSFKFRFFKGFEPVSLQISPEERQMAEQWGYTSPPFSKNWRAQQPGEKQRGKAKRGYKLFPPPPLKKKLLIFGQIISLSFLKIFKQKGVSQTWIQFFSLYLRWTVRDVHGTQEVGMNDPPRSSFTKELFPLFVCPTTRRVDFLEGLMIVDSAFLCQS